MLNNDNRYIYMSSQRGKLTLALTTVLSKVFDNRHYMMNNLSRLTI